MQALRQYAEVVDGVIHLELPKNFHGKRVELIVLTAEQQEDNHDSFQQFLLDSPEMSDQEYQAIEEKRQHLKLWK